MGTRKQQEVSLTSSERKFIDSVNSMDSELGSTAIQKPSEDGDANDRASWGGTVEFILTCIGYAVGLGTVWRFPYLCYKNGGGAYLIPYTIMMGLVGLPLFYMELYMGQFVSLGPLAVWKFSPLFKGLGFASVMVSSIISIYYNVIIAICFYFLFKSMAAEVPWTHCYNTWNTAACKSLSEHNMTAVAMKGSISDIIDNITHSQAPVNGTNITDFKTPSEEFFYNHVLQLTEGLDDVGGLRWELAGCLLLCWVIVGAVLIKGISSLGKVVYFTALFPYLLLFILLIRGAMLEGSLNGVIFYIRPQWNKLLDAQTWSDAAVQVFYALSVASGGLVAMSSYNKFHNNILRDSVIVVGATMGTSLLAGFVIFSVLGYMAHIKNVDVSEVAAQGPGLTFVVYPEALSTMPLPPLWSVLFFFMMIILGFSSEFSLMECVLTALLDEYPRFLKTSRKREIIFRISACVFGFACGLPMVTQGGFYLLNLVDTFAGGFPLIIVGIGELAAVSWVYGYQRFAEDMQIMTGKYPPLYFKVMLCVVSPALMLTVFGFNIYQHKPLSFQSYVYPDKFAAIGWLTVVACVGPIVVCALFLYCRKGGFEVLKKAAAPSRKWRPAHEADRVGTRYEDIRAMGLLPVEGNRAGEGTSSSTSSGETGRLLSDDSLPVEYEEAEKLQ